MTGKIKTQKELSELAGRLKREGRTTGFTNGCFDILHRGHVRYLDMAKKECDRLIIGVNSDASVKRLKGDSRPVNGQEARMEVLSALESVDFVTLFEEDTPEKLIRMLTPDILFKGGDWEEDDIAGSGYVRSTGGKVRIIPYVEGYSTTGVIEKLKKE
ncbi:MAG: D-glycero-beta-D-manno-heptose 1-phosphate adenylyltransferase [Candidatus Omnitrophota bacterium]